MVDSIIDLFKKKSHWKCLSNGSCIF